MYHTTGQKDSSREASDDAVVVQPEMAPKRRCRVKWVLLLFFTQRHPLGTNMFKTILMF